MVGRHDLDGVEVLLFLQQLPEIRIGGNSFEVLRRPLLRVVGFEDFFGHIAAAAYPADAGAPSRILQSLAHAVANAGLVPVDVIRAVLDGVAYGRDLHLRGGDEPQHLSRSLRAATDVSQGDLIAWSDVSRPAQHVPRNQ